MHSQAMNDGPGFFVQLHVTEKCGSRCKHCYQRTWSTGDAPAEAFVRLIDEIVEDFGRAYGHVDFNITGGDPLRYPGLWDVVSHIESKEDATWTLLSSGIGINAGTAARLRDNGVDHVQLSLEGPKAVDGAIRGPDHFEAVCTAIDHLRSLDIDTSICMTVSRFNIDAVIEMINWCDERSLPLGFQRWVPLSRDHYEWLIDETEWRRTVSDVARLCIEGKRVRMNDPLFVRELAEKRGKIDTATRLGVQLGCTIGVGGVTIMHDGTVLPCRKLPLPLGNAFTERLMRIWLDSPELWRFREREGLNGACATCAFRSTCGGCRAYAYAIKGDPYGDDPLCGSSGLC